MKNLTKDENSFEKGWRDAFEGAEMTPSEGLWVNLDAHLANNEAGKLKKGIFWYRWVAAASIVAVFITSGLWFLSSKEVSVLEDREVLSLESAATVDKEKAEPFGQKTNGAHDLKNGVAAPLLSETTNELIPQNGVEKTVGFNNNDYVKPGSNTSLDYNSVDDSGNTAGRKGKNNEGTGSHYSFANATIFLSKSEIRGSSEPLNSSSYDIQKTNADRSLLQKRELIGADLAFLDVPETDFHMNSILVLNEVVKDSNTKKFDLNTAWAALNVTPGSFDPNFEVVNVGSNDFNSFDDSGLGAGFAPYAENISNDLVYNSAESQALSQVNNSASANPDLSYNFGFKAALPIGKKWFVQSGLDYVVSNTSASTRLVVNNGSNGAQPVYISTKDYQENLLTRNALDLVNNVDLKSSYEFIRLPMKAGYLVSINEKFGLLLSAGLSADLFLGNTISDKDGDFESVKLKSGSETPFKSLYFNGISSIAVFYKLSNHYLISVEPSYSHSLTTFTKEGSSFASRPENYGLGLGLTYQFN